MPTAAAPDGSSCRLDNAAGICTGGVCGSPSCSAGFGNCDGKASNGCEDTLSSDANNCGACGNACASSCDSTTVFTEDWESGTGAWIANFSPVVLASDGSACDLYQHETLNSQGGRVFTAAGIPVNGGATYCLSAWIRATDGATPFLGIELSSAAGVRNGIEHWLIGLSGYNTGYPNSDTVTPIVSDGNWAWYTKSFSMDASASDIVIKDENFGGGAADFDMIQLFAGACPGAPTSVCASPVPNCQPGVCTDGVCASPKLMP